MDSHLCSEGSLASQSASWFNTCIAVHFVGRYLNVSLTSAAVNQYGKYDIAVKKISDVSNAPPSMKCTVTVERDDTSVLLKNIHLRKTNYYFVKVEPVKADKGGTCTDMCIPKQSSIVEGISDECILCDEWNDHVNVTYSKYFALKGQISVQFTNISSHTLCFEKFEVFLMKDGYSCASIKSERQLNIFRNQTVIFNSTASSTTEFQDLPAGNYCILIHPEGYEDDICQPPFCIPLCECSISLSARHQNSQPFKILIEGNHHSWLIPLSAICFIVLLFLTAGMWWRWQHKHSSVLVIKKTTKGVIYSPIRKRDIQVFLLYSHDSLLHKNVVYKFAQFLRECCNVMVVLDVEQLHTIFPDQELWLTSKLPHDCDKWADSNHKVDSHKEKKVIIIESKGAVEQQEMREKGRQVDYQCHLEQLFITGLALITSDLSKSLGDYCHLFVVHFDYTPSKYKLKYVVPNQRYALPNHLHELYNALHYSSKIDISGRFNIGRETLQEQWCKKASYQNLLLSIKKAAEEKQDAQVTG